MSSYKELYFLLGASDPEMAAIEAILTTRGLPFCYATANGNRVNPSNAYQAQNNPVEFAGKVLVTIECGLTSRGADIALDHHREGDVGYGLPADQFWQASSIGQLHTLLGIEPDTKAMIVAAADHCLAAAYAGDCPGIDPDAVLHYRNVTRANFTRVSVESITAAVENARLALLGAQKINVGGFDVADLRASVVAEANEASARYALPFVYRMHDARSGKTKEGVFSSNPAIIEAWMASSRSTLDGVYGDPARGYAGGYVKA